MLEIVRGIYEAWGRGDFSAGPVALRPRQFRDDRVVRLVFERDREAALRSVG